MSDPAPCLSCELDDVTEPDRYPPQFVATVNVFVSDTERQARFPLPWTGARPADNSPDVLFSSRTERDETLDRFGQCSTQDGRASRVFWGLGLPNCTLIGALC